MTEKHAKLIALGFRYIRRQGCTFWTPACLVQAGDEDLTG